MAEPTAINWFPGALSVLLGFAAKSVSDWLQDKRAYQRDRETRDVLRRDQLAERRAEFQRQTLLELQEVLQDLARAVGASHHQDEMQFKETGRWQRHLIRSEIDDQFFQANRRALVLTVRVRDESLRESLKRFRDFTSQIESGIRGRNDEDDASARRASTTALLGAMGLLPPIQERIGELLRTLDDEESSLWKDQRNP